MLHNPYSNHYQRIDNPPTPFTVPIQNGLEPGKQIYISATCNPSCDQIKIDLKNGSGQIALHINPRFSQHAIVRNSCLGGWGPEERSGGFPFHRGQNFDVVILVDHDNYKVAINGHHAFEYAHRTSFGEVDTLSVDGDIQIHQIVFSGGAHSSPNEVRNPALPFTIPVLNGLAPGRLIQIHGAVNPGAQRFAVNLQNTPDNYPNDMAFHFNPRYFDGHIVCKNSRRHGGWANEERESFPIAPGQSFEMLILCDPSEFKVALNGHHFTSMSHRNSLHDGNFLNIEGDITVYSVRQF